MNYLPSHADRICSNTNDNKDNMVEIKDLSESSQQCSKQLQLLQTPSRLPQALVARGLDDEEYCDVMNESYEESSSSSVNECPKSENDIPMQTSTSKSVPSKVDDEIPPNNPPLELRPPQFVLQENDKYMALLKQLFLDDEGGDDDDYVVISSLQQRFGRFFLPGEDRVGGTVTAAGKDDDDHIITLTSLAKPILPSTTTIPTSNREWRNVPVARETNTDTNIPVSRRSDDDSGDDDNIITLVSLAKPILPATTTTEKMAPTNTFEWNYLARGTFIPSWMPLTSRQFLTVEVAVCGFLVVYICYSLRTWIRATKNKVVSSSPSSQQKGNPESPTKKRKFPPASTSQMLLTMSGDANTGHDREGSPQDDNNDEDNENRSNNKSGNFTVEVASAALTLLSLSEGANTSGARTSASTKKPTHDDNPSQPPMPNPKSESNINQRVDHLLDVSSIISSLEGVRVDPDASSTPVKSTTTALSTMTLIPTFKKFKISTAGDDVDYGHYHVVEATTPTATIQKLATAIQDTKQALVQCGQDPSLAPMVALLRHERQELVKSQQELEHGRRQWEQHQRNFDRQVSHRQQQETIDVLKTTSSTNTRSQYLWDCEDENRLEQIRDKCWNAVSRLLIEVVLVYRLAHQLGYPLLQVWKKIHQEQQQHPSMDNSLAQLELLLSTVAELACSTCSTRAPILSEAPTASYLYYFLPSPSSSEFFYLKTWWITVMDSGLCYAMCIMRWGGILLATFLVHSLLRIFSAPMSLHNGVNLLGAYWLYMSSSSSSLVGTATSDTQSSTTAFTITTHWQWLVLGASMASLFGMVQFQYWQGQSHIERKWTTLPNDDHDHLLLLRQPMRQMKQFYKRLQFLRLVLIVTYALSWWWWICYPDAAEPSTNPWYPALTSLPT